MPHYLLVFEVLFFRRDCNSLAKRYLIWRKVINFFDNIPDFHHIYLGFERDEYDSECKL